jgi:hypothetical protein
VTSAVLRTIDGLASAADPLDAEIEASRIISLLELDPSGSMDERMALVERLLISLGRRKTPDALALALGLRYLLPAPWTSIADAAANKLTTDGVVPPAWSDEVGGARFEAAWAWTDEFGDQDLIVAAFRYPGRSPHGIRVMADHNFNGLFRQAAIDPDPDSVRQHVSETIGSPLRPITGRDLSTRWAAGTTWYRRYLDAPVYEDVPPLMALLEARARALPAPDAESEPEPMSDDDRSALTDRFLTSAHADEAGLSADPEGRDAVIVDHLIEFRENHGEGDPLRWSPIVVEICLLDWMPRKALLEAGEVEALPTALRAFVRFAAGDKRLAAEHVAETLAAIDAFEPQFRAAMRDDAQAGPAKALARKMVDEGIDLQDPEALQRWIDDFNRRPIEERGRIIGNEPSIRHIDSSC